MVKIPIALIQFDSIPEEVEINLKRMESMVETAVESGARWIMFHEGTICDYTPRVVDLAESVPDGRSTARMVELSRRLNCYISFGLSESHENRYFISQVFTGPKGYVYHYRKSWLWHGNDEGYRNEWARYDPGTGPELFDIEGIKATCFICADADALRCIQRATELAPQVVFHPINQCNKPACSNSLNSRDKFLGQIANVINAPMLVTNRVGHSWIYECKGGCAIYSATGEVLVKANREGKEEILHYSLNL